MPFLNPIPGMADDADIKAIYVYFENQRPLIPKYPRIQQLIESFEDWYGNLTYWDTNIMSNDTLAEATRRRNELNLAMNGAPDPTVIPADRLQNNPGTGGTLPGRKPAEPPLIPTQYKLAGVITVAAVTTLVILKKLHIL